MQSSRGFTLLEILLVIGIFLLLLTGVGYLMIGTFQTQRIAFQQLQGQKEGRLVVENFVKEFRRAAASSIGAYPIEQAAASAVTFYSDIDSDTFRERVRYFLEGSNFKKGVIKPSGTPLTYNSTNETITIQAQNILSDQIFSYFDKNYAGTSTPLSFPVNVTQIRLVQINLVIEQNLTVAPGPLTVTSQAQIRNLKE